MKDEMELFLEQLMGYRVDTDCLSIATKRAVGEYQTLVTGGRKEEENLRYKLKNASSHRLIPVCTVVCVVGFSGSLVGLIPLSSYRMLGGACLTSAIIALLLLMYLSRSAGRWHAAEIQRLGSALNAMHARQSAAHADLMKAVEGDLERVHRQKVRPTVEYRETTREVTVDINRLYDAIKTQGLAVPYRCPSCGGTLKLVGDRRFEKCPYCGSGVDVRILSDLVNALR